jgi:hypothetical protein
LEEEKAVVAIQIGSIPMARQVTVHANPFGVLKDVIMPIRPSRFFHQVKHCDQFLLENPEQSNPLHESFATDLTCDLM